MPEEKAGCGSDPIGGKDFQDLFIHSGFDADLVFEEFFLPDPPTFPEKVQKAPFAVGNLQRHLPHFLGKGSFHGVEKAMDVLPLCRRNVDGVVVSDEPFRIGAKIDLIIDGKGGDPAAAQVGKKLPGDLQLPVYRRVGAVTDV